MGMSLEPRPCSRQSAVTQNQEKSDLFKTPKNPNPIVE